MTDGQLLARYAREGDGESFRLVLERHGAMVLAACRRQAGPEAEDAAQAVFVLLARKAKRLTSRRDIGPWLYRTATFVCGHAVRARERRRTREKEAAEMRQEKLQKGTTDEKKELRRRLDAALNSLPGRYREVMVLCYLEGASQSEAAERLGLPAGTVAARCARGMAKLRGRLSRRGVTLGATALAGALAAESAQAALPAGFASSTLAAATGGGSVASSVTALAKGGMQAMTFAKIKIAAAVLCAATIVGGGGGFVAVKGLSAGEPKATPKRLNPALVKMPANTWVKLRPKRNPVGRSYSGVGGAIGGGYIFYFGGGHGSHPGNDVELYEIASNTWTRATEVESWKDADKWTHLTPKERKRAKGIGGGWGVGLLSPKGRPLTEHTYQQTCYDPEGRRFISVLSPGTWSFDPAGRQWKALAGAHAKDRKKKFSPHAITAHILTLYDPGLKKVVCICHARAYGIFFFDPKTETWERRGKMPFRLWSESYATYVPEKKAHFVSTAQDKKFRWFSAEKLRWEEIPSRPAGMKGVSARWLTTRRTRWSSATRGKGTCGPSTR